MRRDDLLRLITGACGDPGAYVGRRGDGVHMDRVIDWQARAVLHVLDRERVIGYTDPPSGEPLSARGRVAALSRAIANLPCACTEDGGGDCEAHRLLDEAYDDGGETHG